MTRGRLLAILAGTLLAGVVTLVLAASATWLVIGSRSQTEISQIDESRTEPPELDDRVPPVEDSITAPAVDPFRPRMDIVFSGDCTPRFDDDAAIAVQTGVTGHLRIAARRDGGEAGVLGIYPNAVYPLAGRIELTQAYYEQTQNTVLILDGGPGPYANYHTDGGDTPASVLGGFLVVAQWEPARGLVDLTFENVTLRNYENGTLCHMNGRIQTFALTWGEVPAR